jgi:predicted HAD superfamily Cof-like phosphohydrolase
MTETINKVREFHVAFGQKDPQSPVELFEHNAEDTKALEITAKQMRLISENCMRLAALSKSPIFLRLQLIQEELSELVEAVLETSQVGVLDALTDLQYVIDGTYLTFGFNEEIKLLAFDEVHSSNMTKLGEDGKPVLNESGRVQKGPNYRKPDLVKILER